MLLEKTQRRLCRLLFVLGCVLPTLAVAGVTFDRLLPSYTFDLLVELGDRLGVEAVCDHLATPRPGAYRLENLRLLDPATGDLLFRCDELLLEHREGKWAFAGDEATLTLRAREARWLRRLLASGLAGRGELARLCLSDRDVISAVSIDLAKANEQSARLQSRASGGWKLIASGDPSVVTAELETGADGLAADWFAATPLSWVGGDGARFRGEIHVEIGAAANESRGELRGLLATGRIDSLSLTANSGELRIDALRWRGAQIEKLEGRLDLRDGQIARSLVHGACEWLTTPWRDRLGELWADTAREQFDYTQLACEIEIGPEGVTLVAGCGEIDGRARPGAVAHAVLEHEGEALLLEPRQRPLPPQRLVQAWYPDRRAELPADPLAIELMRAMPAPVAEPGRSP